MRDAVFFAGITARSAEGQLTPGDTSLVLAAALVEVVAERCVPLIPPSGADGAAAAGGGAAVAGGGGEGAAAGRALAAAGGGLPAALAILKNVMSQTPVRVRAHSLAHELLSQGFCQLAAAACLWHWDGGQQLRAPPAGVRGVVLEVGLGLWGGGHWDGLRGKVFGVGCSGGSVCFFLRCATG